MVFKRAANRAARFHDVLVVAQCDALDVDRSFQGGKQFRHVQRKAFVPGTASPRRGGALLADERGGRHLPARHAIDGIVHEEDGDLFAAIGGVHDFGGADRREVAVSLIGDHDLVGTGALDGGGAGGRASVGDLHIAHIEIVIGEHRAADRADEDGAVLQAEFFKASAISLWATPWPQPGQ